MLVLTIKTSITEGEIHFYLLSNTASKSLYTHRNEIVSSISKRIEIAYTKSTCFKCILNP